MTTMILLAVALILFIAFWIISGRLDEIDRSFVFWATRAFAMNMIREMENNPRTMPGRLKDGRYQSLEKGIDLNNRFLRPPRPDPFILGGDLPPSPDDLPPGLDPREILEWNEESASKFWKGAQGLRNGALIFIMLVKDKNVTGARYLLDRHEKDGRPQAFQEMRDVLQMGSEVTRRRYRSVQSLNPEEVLQGLDYRPFDEEIVYVGVDILEGMRVFTR